MLAFLDVVFIPLQAHLFQQVQTPFKLTTLKTKLEADQVQL